MTIGTRIFTALHGKFVGEDTSGNKYYIAKKIDNTGKKKRWVIYNGYPEPTKVPAEWHLWLHYLSDTPPANDNRKYYWEKAHIPNLSGTDLAYVPPGHPKRGGVRYEVESDYQAWRP